MSHSQNAQNAALCQAARAGDTQTVLKLLQERDGVGCHANPNTIADADNNVTVGIELDRRALSLRAPRLDAHSRYALRSLVRSLVRQVLMLAAEHGDVDMVHALLEAGASWQERSLDGCTPGEYAMANRADRGCFQLLLEWAVQCEMILGRETLKQREEEEARHVASNDQYLASTITYATDGDIIDDSSGDAVMMTWETPLMERHAADICWKGPGEGVVLNIGFGMGIVDAAIQKREPKRHVIIEAHPDVYRQMLRLGWDKKENVTVVFGRWQDVIDDLAVTTKFDGGCCLDRRAPRAPTLTLSLSHSLTLSLSHSLTRAARFVRQVFFSIHTASTTRTCRHCTSVCRR